MYLPGDETPPHIIRLQKEQERSIRLYEEPGCYGLSVASAEELTDRTPEKIDLFTEWMREEDLSSFDDDGMVR